jgi:uncharacterized protein
LIDADGLSANPTEGESLLRRLADEGDTFAMFDLGERLIDGIRGLAANPTEGESLLRGAADAGDTSAMRLLGARLIEGRGLAANATEGKLLLELADARDADFKPPEYWRE